MFRVKRKTTLQNINTEMRVSNTDLNGKFRYRNIQWASSSRYKTL